MDPENCVTSFHFLLERRLSGDRMLHFVPDSRLTLQLFRNPIIVTRCLELSETVSTFVTRAFALRIPPNENNFRGRATSTSMSRFARIHVASILFQNLETRPDFATHRSWILTKILSKIFFPPNFLRQAFFFEIKPFFRDRILEYHPRIRWIISLGEK